MPTHEHAHHSVYQDALSNPAHVPVLLVEKPVNFTPIKEDEIEGVRFSMVLDNVARNMRTHIESSEEKIAEMEHDARHDKLTNTLNKKAILGYLDELIDEGAEPDVYYLDFNNFRLVNNWAGHSSGDRALVAIATSLLKNLRPGEEIGRMGGDEFVIVKDGRVEAVERRTSEHDEWYADKRSGVDRRQSPEEPVDGVKTRIQSAFQQTLKPLREFLGENLIEQLGISVGHAKFESGKTGAVLVDEADLNMYEDKERSKVGSAVHSLG